MYGHQGGKWQGGGGGGMNWEIGIDIYSLLFIKWITNKNLLYKKINKRIIVCRIQVPAFQKEIEL